jgi:hypothetical protein
MKKTLSDTDIILRSQLADDPHKEIKVTLAEFLLALIQAFLRTGYYTPDHPESQKAKVGLYEDFQNLLANKHELTFMVREELGGKNILIEGVLPEVQDLNSLMIAGMAEMYVPRFVQFLEKKDLLSLTLKNSMASTEFTSFVDLMGEPTFVDTQEKKDKERFSKILQERGIFNISYIYNEELLARERNLHWRSQIALTRLRKDFSMVPLFMDLDLEGMQKVRRQIIQDVFRPFQNAEAIYSVLLNSDLAETEEFRESDIDEEIIGCLSDALLPKVAQALLEGTLRHGNTEPAQGKDVRLAGQLASCLNLREIKERESILEEYVKHKLIAFEHLPKDIQSKIRFEQLTKKILHDSKSFFIQFDKIEDNGQYFRVAQVLTKIIPELISRDQYDAILKIIIILDRHSKEKKDRSTSAGKILDLIGTGEIMKTLMGKFLSGKKEMCQAVSPIFLKLGMRSVSQLVFIMESSKDHLVRKTAGDLIAQIDPSAMNSILDELNKKGLYTGTTIDLLRVLGDVECDEWKQPMAGTLLGYLNHENPHFRVEALKVYYRIKGAEGKTLYHDFLNDKDIGVQKEAILSLAKVKSESGLGKFLEMLEKSEDFPPEKKEQLEACLFRALGLYGNVELPNIGSLEDFLQATLDRQLGSGRLKLTAIRKKGISTEVIAAICEALGKVGTNKSSKILQKLSKQKDTPWQQKAEKALRKIAEREEGKS